jgi:hypothetical protein
MKRFLAFLSIVAALVLVGLVVRARFREKEPVAAPELVFTTPGLAEVRNPGRAQSIEVFDAADRLVARAQAFGRPLAEVRFAWEPGASYRVVGDEGTGSTARAPQTPPQFAVRLHAPLGQAPHEYLFGQPDKPQPRQDAAIPAGPGETVDLMLEIEKLSDGEPLVFQVESQLDRQAPHGLRMEPPIEADGASLQLEFDKQIWTSQVQLGDQLPREPLVITIRSGQFVLPLGLRFVTRTLTRDDLEIEWLLPTEADGFHQRHRVADRITLPNRVWIGIASWLGIRLNTPSSYEPFTYETLRIGNKTDQPISLLLLSEVMDEESERPVEFFAAPEFESTGGTGRIMAYAHVGPGETEPCVLPIYVRPETPEGTYLRRVEIRPLGSDRPLGKPEEKELGVVRSNSVFSGWVIGAGVLSLAWLAATAIFFRRMVRSLGVRVLVLLALLGSLQFCLQFAGGLVSMVFYALLGPFNCLVGGLLTEVMTYLLVTSILLLVPRVGAMTLAGLVTYVMGGVLFGSFGLTDVLFVGSAIAFREILLFGFGVTRLGPPGPKPPKLVPMMLALGLADAASTFTSLALQALFYRLFFAEWYIFLQVVVTGFLYTALGVYLGRSLGISLRRVHQ